MEASLRLSIVYCVFLYVLCELKMKNTNLRPKAADGEIVKRIGPENRVGECGRRARRVWLAKCAGESSSYNNGYFIDRRTYINILKSYTP